MSDTTENTTPATEPSVADRLLRTGLINGLAMGGVFLAVSMFADTPPDGTGTINLALILTNILPIGLICAASFVLIGAVMKLRQRKQA